MPVDIQVTISENLRGYLLVAEIKREKDPAVEMAEFRVNPAAAAKAGLSIERKLLWEQDAQILDVVVTGGQMRVLDVTGESRYERQSDKWTQVGFTEMPVLGRDPRKWLDANNETFTEGRNTIDVHDWRGAFYSSADIGSGTLVGELDGKIHVYDASHSAQGTFDGWGSDFAAVKVCGATYIAASSASVSPGPDSITIYDIVSHAPVPMSESVEFNGSVTALRASEDGLIAVARNSTTGKYAAYSLTVDCRH